jgi:phosphoesterase RecJ-like protein
MSYRVLELWKHGLATVQLHDGVIEAAITQTALRTVGMDEMTDGGLVSLLNTVNEAWIAVVFKEIEPNRVEVSLRSKPGYDVAKVALSLGGGGHPQASGTTLLVALEEARAQVLPLLQTVVEQAKSN